MATEEEATERMMKGPKGLRRETRHVMYAVILSALFASGHCGLTEILTRHPHRVSVASDMLASCLQKMADHYPFEGYELELLIQDPEFDTCGFTRYWNRFILEEGLRMGTTLTVRKYHRPLKFLGKLRRKRRTLFMLVLKRIREGDNFFVDLEHQTIDFEVITKSDIVLDFAGKYFNNRTQQVWEMEVAFRKFWQARVPNVIALVPTEKNIYFYTYFPFTRLNCPDEMVPVLMNVWFSSTGKFYRTHRLFPNKVDNVHLCRLNVSLISSPPGVMVEDGNIDGIEGDMLKTVFQMMNATPAFHFVNPEEVSMNDSRTALSFLLEKVKSGESELGAGFLIPTAAYNNCTDDIHMGLGICLTWAVPNMRNMNGTMYSIMETFSCHVWLTIIFTMVASAVVLQLLDRKDGDTFTASAFRIVAAMLGKAVPIPQRFLPKAFLTLFIWYALLLGFTFQAGLGSNNILFGPPPQLESTRQIIESGFEIAGADSTIHLFNKDIKLIRSTGEEVPVEPMGVHNALFKVAFERRTAYIGLKLAIIYQIRFLNPELQDHIYVHSSCLINYQPFFALRKYSPFSHRVRFLTSALIEGGYKDNLEKKYLSRMTRIKRGRQARSKGDALARNSLHVVAYGWCIGIGVFIAECLFYHRKRLMVLMHLSIRKTVGE
ncbi:UNVERIFIED_CONTAM: hypothetical protein PYX00_005456 [Menopon gallinae]|uniref:Putative ionotropic receptor ligand binding domain-containing protein n=1 Tax=Menopon gallinae TaxID=328185 RepID=A0AAW2HRF0_9NEOP